MIHARFHHDVLVLQLAWLCTGCAIGSPLVDDRPDDDGSGAIQCNPPPGCAPPPWVEPSLPENEPLNFLACVHMEGCVSSIRPGDAPAPDSTCHTETVQALPLVAECSMQSLQAPTGVSELSYEGASWTTYDLSIESRAPLRVVLRSAELQLLALHLEGPVELDLRDSHIENLRIDGLSSPEGEPHIELLRVDARSLRLGTPEDPFEGTVVMRATELHDVDLQLTALETESTIIERGFVHAQSLSAIDTTLSNLDVQVEERTRFAEFSTESSRLQLCGYISLIGGRFSGCILESCEGSEARLYGSIFGGGALDGRFEADQASITNTTIGATSDTAILSFESFFGADSLCGNTVLLAFDPTSSITCSYCDEDFEQADPVCLLHAPPDAASPVEANFCPVLEERRQLPSCDAELPERSRQR